MSASLKSEAIHPVCPTCQIEKEPRRKISSTQSKNREFNPVSFTQGSIDMRISTSNFRTLTVASVIVLIAAAGSLMNVEQSHAVMIPLQNPTATVEQGGFPITNTLTDNTSGWATSSAASIGVYEIVTPLTSPNNIFTFTLKSQATGIPNHVLGKFRLSVTTDTQPLSAGSGSWTVLVPDSASAINSNPVQVLAGNVLEATDVNAATDTITVASTLAGLTGITGFRLEAIQDGGIGNYPGPGIPGNNNFVLTYFEVDAVAFVIPVPEPSSFLLLGLGMLGFVKHTRQKKRKV